MNTGTGGPTQPGTGTPAGTPAGTGAKVRTCLWFTGDGEEAVAFYTSLIADSGIESTFRPDPGKPPLVIDFTLGGTPYQVLNVTDGPGHPHSHAASISVLTEDQAETDRLWTAILDGGGAEVACGWITDRFGLSWQIVPRTLPRLLADQDRAAAGRAMAAMMQMVKLDIAALEAAFRGD